MLNFSSGAGETRLRLISPAQFYFNRCSSMVQIMAEENLDWSTSPAVINETVLAAKEFLDAELAKYETIKKLPANLINLLDSKTNEQAAIKLLLKKWLTIT